MNNSVEHVETIARQSGVSALTVEEQLDELLVDSAHDPMCDRWDCVGTCRNLDDEGIVA